MTLEQAIQKARASSLGGVSLENLYVTSDGCVYKSYAPKKLINHARKTEQTLFSVGEKKVLFIPRPKKK